MRQGGRTAGVAVIPTLQRNIPPHPRAQHTPWPFCSPHHQIGLPKVLQRVIQPRGTLCLRLSSPSDDARRLLLGACVVWWGWEGMQDEGEGEACRAHSVQCLKERGEGESKSGAETGNTVNQPPIGCTPGSPWDQHDPHPLLELGPQVGQGASCNILLSHPPPPPPDTLPASAAARSTQQRRLSSCPSAPPAAPPDLPAAPPTAFWPETVLELGGGKRRWGLVSCGWGGVWLHVRGEAFITTACSRLGTA